MDGAGRERERESRDLTETVVEIALHAICNENHGILLYIPRFETFGYRLGAKGIACSIGRVRVWV